MGKCSSTLLERDVNEFLAQELKSEGFLVLQETRLPPNEIDIIALEPNTLTITCFEIKRENWRALLRQASRARLYSHFSIAVMPKSKRDETQRLEFQKEGLGVLYYDWFDEEFMLTVELKPTLSVKANRFLKRRIYQKFVDAFGEQYYA